MSRDKGALSIARCGNDEAVKPSPPVDLWEQMDKLHKEVDIHSGEDPGFTPEEYASHYGLNLNGARSRLSRLVSMGKMKGGWAQRNGKMRRVFRPV